MCELKIQLEELRKQINVEKENWEYYESTNCYAYALGLDIPCENVSDYAYVPGSISNCNRIEYDKNWHKLYKHFIYCLYSDFDILGIDYKEISPDDIISSDEWKIAIYAKYFEIPFNRIYMKDFHFLRQSKDGIWYHKMGWGDIPISTDSNKKIITNLKDCYIEKYQYKKCLKLKLR